MNNDLFYNFDKQSKNNILKKLNAKNVSYKKEAIIASNLNNIDTIGIIQKGKIEITKYDENGKKTIINTLGVNDIFGSRFTYYSNTELFAISKEDCSVLFIEYEKIIKSKHPILISNLITILSNKVLELNNRIDLLTKKTIRDKLLDYFQILYKQNLSKSFYLNMSYTDLSDYLSVDRSALMREIKKLRDDKLINTNGRKITILY